MHIGSHGTVLRNRQAHLHLQHETRSNFPIDLKICLLFYQSEAILFVSSVIEPFIHIAKSDVDSVLVSCIFCCCDLNLGGFRHLKTYIKCIF